MNPSIDTIASAINKLNARNVFILPNNSNIILAAQQAAELTEKRVILLPIPQGIAACMSYSVDETVENNEQNMRAAFTEVVSGAVTYAVRDSKFNGSSIHKGDIIGLLDNKIDVVGSDVETVCMELVQKMFEYRKQQADTAVVYYGEGQTEDAANALVEKLAAQYADVEFLVQYGGQPLYYYYIAVQ